MKNLGAITDDKDVATKEYVDSHGGGTSITVTLASASWSNNTQTVTASGVTSSSNVIVSPAPSDLGDYGDAGIYCSAQGTDSLTFTCTTTPSADITVNVLVL